MNHQSNTGDNQNRQTNFKQNSQSQYTGQSQYNQNQYGQRSPHMQNIPQGQYGQQQTKNQNQFNHGGLQHLRQAGNLQNQRNQQFNNQQSKMIKNPEKNVTHSPEMNDRDYLNDILATEKYLTDGFNTFAREASHTELHNDVMTILNDTHDCTRDLFNLMFKDGFYSFQGTSGQEVQQAQQKFSKYLSQQDPYGTNNMGF